MGSKTGKTGGKHGLRGANNFPLALGSVEQVDRGDTPFRKIRVAKKVDKGRKSQKRQTITSSKATRCKRGGGTRIKNGGLGRVVNENECVVSGGAWRWVAAEMNRGGLKHRTAPKWGPYTKQKVFGVKDRARKSPS